MKQKQKQKRPARAPLFDLSYFPYDFGRITGVLPGLLWFRPIRRYESPAAKKRLRGGAILIFNHSGFVDPILAQFAVWYRRQHFVAAKEIFPGKRRILFRLFHCIEVDRQNFSFGTFREITRHIEEGKVVSIFPEGHIRTDADENAVAAFKSGVVMMALRTGCPILPVYIKKPRRFPERAVFCVGEPIDLRQKYGGMPDLRTVAAISGEMRQKMLCLGALAGDAVGQDEPVAPLSR